MPILRHSGWLPFAMVALVFAVHPAPLQAAQANAVIEGYVRGEKGRPLENVPVFLKNMGGAPVDQTRTDREGHYVFFQIGAGVFFVSVEPEHPYVSDSRRVQIRPEETDPRRREDFFLDRLAVRSAPKAVAEPVFLQEVPTPAQAAFDASMASLRSGEEAKAVAEMNKAVKLFPEYFLALNQLGLHYLVKGDVEQAGRWFQKALSVNANSASANFGMGWVHYQREELPQAFRALQLSAKLNDTVAETQYYLGLTAIELQKWREAGAALETYLDLAGKRATPATHLYLTSVYDQLGNYPQAAKSLETYLAGLPSEERTPKLLELLEKLREKKNRKQE